jgi:hypothetical protein
MRLGASIGKRLQEGAMKTDDAEALAVADMLLAASRPENIYYAEDLHNADGECFDGYGSLNVCTSRLDPAYMKSSSSRAARRTEEALSRVRPQSGEHLRLLTVTMPKLDASFETTLRVLDDALVLLKKRQWFTSQVRGAVIGTESTLGELNDHFHAHAHMLAWSKWINWAELGNQWSSCLEAAARRHGVEMRFETEHNRAVVDVRLVTSKRRGKGTVSIADAVREVCKYIVKGSDFEKLPVEQLVEVERVLHGRRMVQTFGECNHRKGKVEAEERAYLDTQNTNHGEQTFHEDTPGASRDEQIVEKPRLESLRATGARMIREGNREGWLKTLAIVFARRREWRRQQLAERYPAAIFRTLDGLRWGFEIVEAQHAA